jgi:hypothetical protein
MPHETSFFITESCHYYSTTYAYYTGLSVDITTGVEDGRVLKQGGDGGCDGIINDVVLHNLL